jgi:hypothetical protein
MKFQIQRLKDMIAIQYLKVGFWQLGLIVVVVVLMMVLARMFNSKN